MRRPDHGIVVTGTPTEPVVSQLHASGQHESVAALLASTHWSRLHTIGLSDLRVILAALPADVVRRHPEVLVARRSSPSPNSARSTLAPGRWRVPTNSPPTTTLSVPCSTSRSPATSSATSTSKAAECGPNAPWAPTDAPDPIARPRAQQTLAKIDMWEGTTEAFLRAERLLLDAISSYRMCGEDQWEASAWLELGWTHNLAGAFDRSLDAIGRSVHLLGAASSQRASTLTFHADVLIEVGRYEEASTALREAETIARELNDHAGLAYAAWGLARLRSRQRDHAGTLSYLRQVELHRTDWYRRPAGAAFHGEAAEMLVHLGDEVGAIDHFDHAERLDSTHHTITDVPKAMLEARFGDPEHARELLAALIADPTTWERNRWRYLIYAAWAAHRAGDEDDAAALCALAVGSVEALGHPELLAIGEPELHAHFLGAPSEAEDRWEIVVLGRFEVRRNGVVVRVPPGSAVWITQHLAVSGAYRVDEVTDRLWPDVDTPTARRRLRNLLDRLRAECGAIVERVGDRLCLSPNVTVDLAEFQRTVAAVGKAPAAERAGLARVRDRPSERAIARRSRR